MMRWWLWGLLQRRRGRLAAVAIGIAAAVALLAALGTFLAASKATMTRQAVAGVAVDWQVQVAAGADPATVATAVAGAPGVTVALPVGYATSSGLTATTGGSTQTTGTGVVLGLPAAYPGTFPGQIRTLAGAADPTGALLAQQTAATLHAAVGDTVQIGRRGLAPVAVPVGAVVDLPQANSLFQTVGAPATAQPAAPPDNVVLLPVDLWHQVFDPLATGSPELVRSQLHVGRSHALPADPAAAYTVTVQAAHHLEAALAGAGSIGDNLGAALAAARSDALYAQVLFVFLGLPGAVLAGLLTAALAGAGAQRRRRDQALLRARGATGAQLVRLAAVEAVVVGIVGIALGQLAALAIGRLAFGSAGFGASAGSAVAWAVGASVVGAAIAVLTVLLPARRDAREITVAAARLVVGRPRRPRWLRFGVDLVLLSGAAVVFAITTRTGYTLVLVPEGTSAISVNYWAFAGPALLWAGAALLAWRTVELLLARGRGVVAAAIRPWAGPLAGTAAAVLSRQRRVLARSVVLLALAVAFAASTATFNATYRQQAEVDARLSAGADVTVTPAPGADPGPVDAARLAAVPGVHAVEPIQHRYAYIGTDLQDLYGVRPGTVGAATKLQDAYFTGGTAAQLLASLARQPDAVLVSAETVKDYQLTLGDQIMLRLPAGRDAQLISMPFRYAGVVKEFPTAPKDSFFVANADYVAARTGSDAVGAFLLDTAGADPAAVAARVRQVAGPAVAVTDITTSRTAVGSSLTAVDLAGLTRVELGFALVLAVAASGLVLALGFTERRRTLALATALGARRRQLGAFLWSEAAVVLTGGLVAGAILGAVLSSMLVAVLTGVFDPPPAQLAVPWLYLLAVTGLVVLAVAAAVAAAGRLLRRPLISQLREL